MKLYFGNVVVSDISVLRPDICVEYETGAIKQNINDNNFRLFA